MSLSRFGLVDQSGQERPDRFGHIGLLPLVPDDAVPLVDLELVAELVSSAWLTTAERQGSCGQERRDESLLVCGQIGRVEAGDHVQTCEATTSDKLEVHHPKVMPGHLPSPLAAHQNGRATSAIFRPDPDTREALRERDLDGLPACANRLSLRAGGAVARLRVVDGHSRELRKRAVGLHLRIDKGVIPDCSRRLPGVAA